MNLNALMEVLNANKEDKLAVVGMKGKVVSAVVADNFVKLSLDLVPSKKFDLVADVLVVLGKLDLAAAGALEVLVDGKAVASAVANDEGYVLVKLA